MRTSSAVTPFLGVLFFFLSVLAGMGWGRMDQGVFIYYLYLAPGKMNGNVIPHDESDVLVLSITADDLRHVVYLPCHCALHFSHFKFI